MSKANYKIYQLSDQLQSLVEHAYRHGRIDQKLNTSWEDSNTKSVLDSIIKERKDKGLFNKHGGGGIYE